MVAELSTGAPERGGDAQVRLWVTPRRVGHEKKYQQLVCRHGLAFIRHVVAGYQQHTLSAEQAAQELGITSRWLRRLAFDYGRARAQGQADTWQPRRSGGNRQQVIPSAVEALWRNLFKAQPPASYSFAASEALRRHQFAVDRATVRRWALQHQLLRPKRPAVAPAPVRRWQCGQIGALWQLDVSPHAWFGPETELLPLFDMLDDCSRVITGTRLYAHENLLAYVDFLSSAFATYGLPLALYVDYHSFFFTHLPDALTYLGHALHFYDISFRYAPTPQAKGKVERLHQFWQNRLPTFFAAERIQSLTTANPALDQLREHHNRAEVHRELQCTPWSAWTTAKREKRSVLRPCPRDPWWRYIWSVRTEVKVDFERTVPAGVQRLRLEACAPKTKLIRCEHPDGSYSFLLHPPRQGKRPVLLGRLEAHHR